MVLPARGPAPIFPVARSGLVACINLAMLLDAAISTDSMGDEYLDLANSRPFLFVVG
jgi:hypothetical protein